MSRERAVTYANHVVQYLGSPDVTPQDRAILMASLAQVEATLEVADRLQGGMSFDLQARSDLDVLSSAIMALVRKMGH